MTTRLEFPRPDFEREHWLALNGRWDFEFDDHNIGHQQTWFKNHRYSKKIEVPFCFQSIDSGIHDLGFHDHIWYHRTFAVPSEYDSKRVILHIGACDYESEVYLNGCLVKTHQGGNSSYEVDITNYLSKTIEDLVIYAFDPSTDEFIPRGKQYWKLNHESIWYPRTSGLWQSVWLEFVDVAHLQTLRMTPDIDKGILTADITMSTVEPLDLEVKITSSTGEVISTLKSTVESSSTLTFDIFKNQVFKHNVHHDGLVWSPECPTLFHIQLTVSKNNVLVDTVKSYFGMRKIHIKEGVVFLNNRPYYQKLVLDQGYYPTGLLTAPTDEDFIKDITLAKAMGFNGARRHQLVSDPRYLYHADRLGFLVWGEMANAANYNLDYAKRMMNEWGNVVTRDYNHPCIITWVPINESWGVPAINHDSMQQAHTLALYHLTKSLDSTRPVVSNDGWEQTLTDLCTIHNYAHGTKTEKEKQEAFKESLATQKAMIQSMPANRNIYAEGYFYRGEPILLTEFGGISFSKNGGWGYTEVENGTEFLVQYQRIIKNIRQSECIRGFCYTQLTDVFQEKNGLLSFDRVPKVELEKIKAINDFKPHPIKKL